MILDILSYVAIGLAIALFLICASAATVGHLCAPEETDE